jgi:hypothetical protein
MTSAFRGHYAPATHQILPDADPYIAALVLEANFTQNAAPTVVVYHGRAHLAYGPAYHGSTDPRARFTAEASPPLVADPAPRTDRRQTPGRKPAVSHRSRWSSAAAHA